MSKSHDKTCPEVDLIGLQRSTWPPHHCSCKKAAGHSSIHKCPHCEREWNHAFSRTKKGAE